MKLRFLILALASAVALRAADTVPLFNAMLTSGKEHRFVLISPAGKTSAFLRLGETFEGYKLAGYDAKQSMLDLEKDGKVTHVSLMGAAAIANAPSVTPATLADAQALMSKMHFEEMLEKSIAQQRKSMAAMVEQMAGKTNRPGINQEDFVAFQKKMMDEMMSMVNPAEMKNDMVKIYSELFSKEEMESLAAFYSTPTGEALIAKQPEVAQRAQALLMPRMMAAMPKIQQMSKDFALEQKAKRDAAQGAAPAPPEPAKP